MNDKRDGIIYIVLASLLVVFLATVYYGIEKLDRVKQISADYYSELGDSLHQEDPLKGISGNFVTDPDTFESNLPLAVVSLDGDLPEYKTFNEAGMEVVDTSVDPWTTGNIVLFDDPSGVNRLTNEPVLSSDIRIKKRGHTSIAFDKPQYYLKFIAEDESENPQSVLGMPSDDSWILCGNMADKSMIRNYLAYRVSAHIMKYAPRSCFCALFTLAEGEYTSQGIYLMQESVRRSDSRVQINESKRKEVYTSYLVRRDRYTNFDTMIDDYARIEGLSDEWIGVKYPAVSKQSEENLAYISEDFSNIERVLMSDRNSVFKSYPKYIDTDSFVDYFIINEYFGNYDAGEHSTYMYKNSGDRLKIGPVWDFDQAMNNSVVDEADPYTIAMQDRAFYENLVRDTEFIDKVKKRYSFLREYYLNDEYIFSLIDETIRYLDDARQREWYRWAADYYDDSYVNPGRFYLSDYEKEGIVISRFNDDYDQEIYNIKTYLSIHGSMIQTNLTQQAKLCDITTGLKGEMTLLLVITCCLFAIPSILINRK